MEIERKDSRDKLHRIFCEKHKPLKIVKEMEERDRQTVDEIQRFCKVIEKCMEIDMRHQLKPHKHQAKEAQRQVNNNGKAMVKQPKMRKEGGQKDREKVKKWRERDKKMLFEQVKEKYLMFRKMRVNLVRIDPNRKVKRPAKGGLAASRKRSKKRDNKKSSHTGGGRAGLRSALPGMEGLEELKAMEEEKLEVMQDMANVEL